MYTTIRLAALSLCFGGAASAATLTDSFTSFWVLGDSLSGYIGETGGDTTIRASDGPLWSEQIIQDFDNAGVTAQSFASLGATAGLTRDGLTDPDDLTEQVGYLLAESANYGDTPLVAIWIGGNDIGAVQQGMPIEQAFLAYQAAITALVDADIKNFLLFEVPDVGSTVFTQGFGEPFITQATLGSQALNEFFLDVVAATLPSDVTVTIIETFALTGTALNDPTFFGAERTGPCFDATLGFIDDCTQTSFWDDFHPTNLLHSYVADQVRAVYATPVPLPAAGWLLVAGLGGLMVLRRRS